MLASLFVVSMLSRELNGGGRAFCTKFIVDLRTCLLLICWKSFRDAFDLI